VKLLRMLQERVITRLGSNEEIAVDVRLIAATKSDLRVAAKRQEFREDLYFRLGVAELHIPPLNDRREDNPPLFGDFVREVRNRHQRELARPAGEDLERLVSHDWRGNVRELRNVAERYVLGIGRVLDGTVALHRTLPEQMDAVETVFIRTALQESGGN